jgi:hypothetical protein
MKEFEDKVSSLDFTTSSKLPNPEMDIYYHVRATIPAICIWPKLSM